MIYQTKSKSRKGKLKLWFGLGRVKYIMDSQSEKTYTLMCASEEPFQVAIYCRAKHSCRATFVYFVMRQNY